MPGRIRTYRQARGLQRCSTNRCGCCGKDGRGRIYGRLLLESWATLSTGDSMHASILERHMVPACARCEKLAVKGKRVFVSPAPEVQQCRRVVILELRS